MVMMIVTVSVMVIVQARVGESAGLHWTPELVLEQRLDARVLLRRLDLLDF